MGFPFFIYIFLLNPKLGDRFLLDFYAIDNYSKKTKLEELI